MVELAGNLTMYIEESISRHVHERAAELGITAETKKEPAISAQDLFNVIIDK